MNIDDITEKVSPPDGPIIVTIFDHQKKLMEEYDRIENLNGIFVPRPPYNLDNIQVQLRIKDMFWRTTEELAEAVETIPPLFQLSQWTEFWDQMTEIRHFFEELADALHFLVEASIIAGLDPLEDVHPLMTKLPHDVEVIKTRSIHIEEINYRIAGVIFKMGLAANVFKNKPWKQTQMPTDIEKFKNKLIAVWSSFVVLWHYLRCNQKHIYIFYAKKNLVNQWRQKTNY